MEYEITLAEAPEVDVAVVRGRVDHEGIPAFVGQAFGEVLAVVGEEAVCGPPFSRYAMLPGAWDIRSGFPVSASIEPEGSVEPDSLPGGPLVSTLHVGPYQELGMAYDALESWIASHGFAPAGDPWESYLDGPEVPEPRTLISWPVQPV